MKIDAATQLYCIFGNPVGHSLSPAIHNAWFQRYNMNKRYVAFAVEDIKKAIAAVRVLGIQGCSITIPHKVTVMKCLDVIEPLAEAIGAVNTIVNVQGQLTGYNTDGLGLLKCFTDRRLRLKGKKLLILGSGGAARAAFFSLTRHYSFSRVVMAGVVRKELNVFKKAASAAKIDFTGVLLTDAAYQLSEEDVIVNCSPVGMTPAVDRSLIERSTITRKQVFFDVVYSPPFTRMLKDARRRGAKVISGKEMFVNQALLQHELWTGNRADPRLLKRIL